MQLDEESATKRPRIDQPQEGVLTYELADVYRELAKAIGCADELIIIGSGMYIPSLRRFIKIATCAEKATLQKLVGIADESTGLGEFPGQPVADFYKSIWQTHMLRPLKNEEDDGIILLLIEPISITLDNKKDFTWAGLLTEYLPAKYNPLIVLSRCNGVAPFLYHHAKENKIDISTPSASIQAMPSYFRLLTYATVGRKSTCLARFLCREKNAALGAVLKALAYRLNPDSTKYSFAFADTYEVYLETGFFHNNKILPYLTNNNVIKPLQEIIPLAIKLKLPERSLAPIKFNFTTPNSLFRPVKPAVFITEAEYLQEIVEHTKAFPEHACYVFARHCQTREFPNVFKRSSVQRELSRFILWRNIFNVIKPHNWKLFIKNALDSLLFGNSNYEYTLLSLYYDLGAMQSVQPTQLIESILPQLYWLILNCTEVERGNLNIRSVTLIKFQIQFEGLKILALLQDLWFLLRCIDNKDERRKYLEVGLSDGNVSSNFYNLITR